MRIGVSGSKSKERGCIIFLGIGEAKPRTKYQENRTGLVLNTNTFGKVERPVPTCGRYDTSFSKFCSALLKGIDTRNIPRHLVAILPNIGSLRL
jgi:hypothetical protein